MASALPILTTNVGGIPEMIINGETGILVSHGNEDEFVTSLVELINMNILRRDKIGQNAQEFAIRKFSIETLAKKNYDIYKRISKYSR